MNRAFGIYREFPEYGYLPATRSGVQNARSSVDTPTNSAINPVRPGKLLMLWGTGLGPAPGDEAAGPIPGDLRIPGWSDRFARSHSRFARCRLGIHAAAQTVPLRRDYCYFAPTPRLPVGVVVSSEDDFFIELFGSALPGIGLAPGELVYAGGVPGSVCGLLQVKVRLPAGLAPGFWYPRLLVGYDSISAGPVYGEPRVAISVK